MAFPVRSLTGTATSTSEITLSWSAPSSGTVLAYSVQWKDAQLSAWNNIPGLLVTAPTWEFVSGVGNRLYDFRVQAIVTEAASTDWVSVQVRTQQGNIPNPPENVMATGGRSSITVTWDAPSSGGTPTIYRVSGRLATSEIWRGWGQTDHPATTFTQDRLGAENEYQVRVQAENGDGSSDYSDIVTATTTAFDPPAAPTNISVSGASESSLTVSWSSPQQQAGDTITAQLQYKTSTAQSWNDAGTVRTPHTVTGLLQGQTYSFRVRFRGTGGNSGWTTYNARTLGGTRPNIPRSVIASSTSPTAVSVTWEVPSAGGSVDAYEVEYKLASASDWTAATDVTSPSEITGLTASTDYNFRVRATGAGGESNWVEVDATTQDIPPPDDPESVEATATSTTAISVTWTAPSAGGPVSAYEVEYKLASASDWTAATDVTSPSEITGLTASTDYNFRVRATGAGGESDWVTANATTQDIQPPNGPRTIAASGVDEDSIRITWAAPSSGEPVTSYSLRYREGTTGTWTEVTGIASTDTSLQIDMLKASTAYQVQMQSVGTGGSSAWIPTTPISATTNDPPVDPQADMAPTPSPPRRFTGTSTGTTVNLTWLAPASSGTGGAITGYNVWRWHKDDGWNQIAENTGSTSTMYEDTGLTDEQWYWYAVRAINAEGHGEWSGNIAVFVGESRPSMPRRLTVDAQSSGVVLDWLAPLDSGSSGVITGYNIWRWHTDSGWTEIVADTESTATSYTDMASLTAGQWYYYAVRAINSSGSGHWSGNVGAIVNPGVPSAPRRVFVDAQSTGVVLDWLEPADLGTGGAITGYNIWRWHVDSGWTEIVADTGSATTHYTDTASLTVGQWYWYAIRARNADGAGEWSALPGAIINPSVPSAPRRLTVEESATGITLRWLAPMDSGLGGAITGYNIWRRSDGTWTEIVTSTNSNSRVYEDTSMLSAGWHQYAVRAVNASGNGEWSETSAITTATDVASPPTSMTAVAGTSGVGLTWASPRNTGGSAVTGYRVYRSNGIAWTQLTSNAGVNAVTYTDTDILGDGLYFYRVQAVTANGVGDFSGTAQVLIGEEEDADPTPSPPRRFTADAQSTGVVMDWLAPATSGSGGAISSYQVWRSDGGAFAKIADPTTTHYTDASTLTTDATYYYAIRAVNASGNGEWSGSVSVIINSNVPSAPRRLTVEESTSGVTARWLAPLDSGLGGAITGYKVYRSPDGATWTQAATVQANIRAYEDMATLSDGWTWYAVRAVNASGDGEWSATAGINSSNTVPGRPTAVTAVEVATGIQVSWSAPSFDGGSAITGYRIWRSADGSMWTRVVASTAADATSYIDTSTLADGTYFYRMQALNANGAGDFSGAAPIIKGEEDADPTPSPPRRLTADAQSTGVVLAWLAPTSSGSGGAVTGYQIWRSDGGAFAKIRDHGTTVTWTDTASLTSGATYFYALRAVNASGNGEWSGSVAVIIDGNLPSAPRRLSAVEVTAGVKLDWLAPVDSGTAGAVTGYAIYHSDTGETWTEVTADTGSTDLTYTYTTALGAGWNWFSVRAKNADGLGEWSETAAVTSATDLPSAPQALYAVEIDTGVKLLWTAPASDGGSPITGYRIWRAAGEGNWERIQASTGSTDVTYTDTAIVDAGHGLYFYRVQAITDNGPGDFSAAAPVQYGPQTDGTSEAPTGLVALHGPGGAIQLSWKAPTNSGTHDIDGYAIQCWTVERGWYVCDDDTESTDTDHSLPAATVTGVHRFRVAALTEAGMGLWSLPATILVDQIFGPAGDRKTLGDSTFFAPTRILRHKPGYTADIRDRRHGYDLLRSGLHRAQPEWWSWTAQGGSDSATIRVAALHQPEHLGICLDWIGHDVTVYYPNSAHALWSGYINSVTIPAGDFAIRRSLDGYANDLKIKWTRPATEHQGEVDFVTSAVNPEAAWQQDRFGVWSVIVESDNTLVDIDQDDVSRLLEEYQNAQFSARMDLGIPSGAVLECRGHAGILDRRFFPTRAAGQYGSVAIRDDENSERISYRIDNGPPGHNDLYQYADLSPNEGHGPMDPDFDVYLRRVRFSDVQRVGSGTKQRFSLGLFALGSGIQPGAALSAARVQIGYQQPQNVPKRPSKSILDINWAADGDPILRLPAGGWYFGLLDDSEHHDSGFHFDRTKTPYWPASTNSGRLLVRDHSLDGYSAKTDHLSYDFFVGVTAEGLAKWLASEYDDIGAWPANAAAGVYGAQVGMYYEGDTSWRQVVEQMAYADRLCYAIDENKNLRFWSADGADAVPLEWTGGGANLGAFIGRRMKIGPAVFLLTGASYDALSGQVDFSTPGQPSATVAGSRLGSI